MGAGNVKLARDRYENDMQFGHIDMSTTASVTTAGVWDATSDRHVRIAPSGDTYIAISLTAVTPSSAADGFLLTSAEYFIVRAGEYIGASAAVSVVSLGEN